MMMSTRSSAESMIRYILENPQITVVSAGFHVSPEVIVIAANAKFEAVNKILPMPDFYALPAVEI